LESYETLPNIQKEGGGFALSELDRLEDKIRGVIVELWRNPTVENSKILKGLVEEYNEALGKMGLPKGDS